RIFVPGFSNPLVVRANDADQVNTSNAEIRYQLLDYVTNFTINQSTGEIKPIIPVDFEAIPQARGDIRVLVLTVRALDAGQPPLASNTTVKIFVQDGNDNAPVFLQNFYSQSIPEDIREGSSVLRVEAIDADDSPAFSKIAYRIKAGAQDKFVIDAMSGIISVAPGAYLDPDRTYPKSKLYTLTIVALDGGLGEQQMWAACQVNISIVDVNNKPPTMRPPGIVHIMEDTQPGEEVGQLVATDPDDNPDLSYSLCGGDDALSSEVKNEESTVVPFNTSDTFRIDLKSGKIYLRQRLDREKVETIKMCVQVVDEAKVSGEQLSQTLLNIKVGDVNDNAPVFRKPFYREAVTENSKIGSPVVTVRAIDIDKNRSISYSLEGPSDLLKLISIDIKTGEVLVSDKIDRETTAWINVTLKATDSGVPPLTGMTSLSIQVLDENDNNPAFVEGPTEFHVSEDSALGTVVARLRATDADAGEHGRITYALDPSGTHGKFKIDKDTGIITVAALLDREDIPQFTLIVQAWDNYEAGVGTDQSRRSFKQITIHLSDVNDERPVFVRQAVGECAEVSEFLKTGETVLMVSASDKDEPGSLNSRLVFSMDIDQPDNVVFDVESLAENQARILTKSSVRGKVGNYSLTLRARDQGFPILHAIGRFNICVQDVNDHAPLFIKPPQNYTIRIPENATIGTVVVEVLADDEDHGSNAQVRYRLKNLQNNHWKSFAIDELTGVMTLRAPLDRETQKVYELRVEASDQGTPTALTNDLDLTIYVTDVNDYAPEFTQDVFQLTFTENMSPGQEMYKLLATVDRDDEFGQNKPIPCYYIVGGNEDNRFSLDIFTHQLVATEVLDREEQAHYSLLVQASDDCFHQPRPVAMFDAKDNSLLQVDIKVLDVNDNPPRFTSRVFTGGVTTEANFGTTFMRVQAVDVDQGENCRVFYFLEGEVCRTLSEGLDPIQGSPFVLDRRTGEISLNFYPQRGMKGYFDFKVIANDSEGLFDTATVYIYLLREDQRVRFVLRLTPDEFKEKETEFRMVMANITGAIVNIDEIKVHENDDGTVDRTKSDIYLHFVNRDDNTIMEAMTAISLIDQNSFFLDKLFKDFNVLHSEPAEVSIMRIEEDDPFKTWLMGAVIFLTVMLVLVISLCVAQKKRYQRQLKAATVAAFGTSNSGPVHKRHDFPNTNQHSVEGSNPIWMHSYDNEWFHKDDEDLQRAPHSDSNSLDENAVVDQDQDHTDQASGSGSDRYSTSNLVNDRYVINPQSRSQAHSLQKTQEQSHGKARAPPVPEHRQSNHRLRSSHQAQHQSQQRNNFNTVLDVGVDYSHIFTAKMGTPNRLDKLEVSEL
ncbi:cadherin-23-like, partial [Tropilaelaps mercedesae]